MGGTPSELSIPPRQPCTGDVMIDPKQIPIRLLDDAHVSDELRRDLELASSHAPITYDVEAGLARFEQARLGTKLDAAAGSGLRVLGWVIGATVLLGGALGAAGLIGQDEAPRITAAMTPPKDTDLHREGAPVAGLPSSHAPKPGEPVAEPGHQARVGDAGAALAQPEGGDPALDAPKPPRPATTHPDATDSDADAPTPSLADEAVQINAARQALANDPAKTLALMQAAEQQFPNGAMIQERRGYAILALVALGRTAEAEQQANAYLERWPNGPLSRRVKDALGR
jgi:hypothetical protein